MQWNKILLGLFLITLCFQGHAEAASGREIDAAVDTALERFEREVTGASDLLKRAKAVLVLPKVIKAGFVIGGEYGEGALRVNGKTKNYYNIMSGSFGLQLGAQVKSIYLLFMDQAAWQNFNVSDGWEVGVDGSVALVTVGAGGSVDTTQTNQPVMGFILGQKGLMYNLTLEGSKFNRIEK